MSEEISKTMTVYVSLNQFARAVMAACAMIEAAVEQCDDTATSFNEGLWALGNEMKTHADYIYNAAIEPIKTISLTTKIRIKSEIDKLDRLIDAYEQVREKQSGKKKGADNEK